MTARKPVLVVDGGASQLKGPVRKSSGTFAKTDPWTDKDEVLLRHEVELRYRDRTPPRSPEEADPRDRVTLEEMWVWALEKVTRTPPRTEAWEDAFYAWYDTMVERNPVHLQWLDRFALCGAKGEMPPIRTTSEDLVTCQVCKAVFGSPETDVDN